MFLGRNISGGEVMTGQHFYKHLAEKITSLQTNSFGDVRLRFFLENSPRLFGHPISGPKERVVKKINPVINITTLPRGTEKATWG